MRCGAQVSSRRALRADPAFDKIIQTLYPDMDAYKEKEEEFILRVNAESHAFAAAAEEGLRRQVRTNTHSAPSPPRGLVSARRGLVSAHKRFGVRATTPARGIPSPQFRLCIFVFLSPFQAVCVSVCECECVRVCVSVPCPVLDVQA